MTVVLPLVVHMSPWYDGHIGMYLIKVDFEVIHDVVVCRHKFGGNPDRRACSCTERRKPLVIVILNWCIRFCAIFPLSPDIWGFEESASLHLIASPRNNSIPMPVSSIFSSPRTSLRFSAVA